jgi:prepilin-type N-terminal cleavage/methylation domain-containing protein
MRNSFVPEPRALRPAAGPACAGSARSGVTLVELLIVMAILVLVAVGLRQAVGSAAASFIAARNNQALLANGRFAMERIVFFVQESDGVTVPAGNTLWVIERVLDIYDNATHAFTAAGDGLLDADNNRNRVLNDNILFDLPELVQFRYDGASKTLFESLPNYSTANLLDQSPETAICESVTRVSFSQPAANLVQIEMTLDDGQSQVVLQTRAKARMIIQ